LVVAPGGLRADHLAAELVALLAQVVALLARMDRVAEPAREVAERLQGAAGAVLDRRQDLEHPALHRVQASARALAEICG